MDHPVTSAANTPVDPAIEAKVRAIADAMPVLHLIGAAVTDLAAGRAVMELPYNPQLAQQHGYHHAGITSLLADNTGGLAAATLMPLDSNVLTVEFKINLLAPAKGDRFRAVADVVRAGRTLSVVEATVYALTGSREKPIARMQQTCIAIPERDEMADKPAG